MAPQAVDQPSLRQAPHLGTVSDREQDTAATCTVLSGEPVARRPQETSWTVTFRPGLAGTWLGVAAGCFKGGVTPQFF